jgi:hypothetical protein
MQSNIRNLWFGASLVFAAVLGIYSSDFNQGLIDLVTFGALGRAETAALMASPAVSFTCSLVLVGLTAFFLGYVGLAVFDGVLTTMSRNRLNMLSKALYGEETPSREAFVDCFSLSPELVQAARRHAEKLYVYATRKKQSGTVFAILRTSLGATKSFRTPVLVEQRLLVWFFRVLGPTIIGTGIFCFAATLAIGTGGAVDEAAPAMTPLATGSICLAVAGFGAMLIVVLERAITGFRHSQLASLCDDIDSIYRPSNESVSLEEIVRASHESAELVSNATLATQEDFRATMRAASKEIADKLDQNSTTIVNSLTETTRAQGPEISSAITKALSEPITELKTATETVASKQGEQVADLVKTALEAFVRELKSIVGDQFTQIDQLMKSSVESAGKFEKIYSDAFEKLDERSDHVRSELIDEFKSVIETLKTEETERVKGQTESIKSVAEEFKAVIETIKSEETARVAAQTDAIKAMTEELGKSFGGISDGLSDSVKEIATGLSADTKEIAEIMAGEANRHAEEFNAALDRAIEAVKALATDQLQRSTDDLAHTAATFESLHTSLENIVTLVTPMIRQVIENQESLLTAIESESSNSRVLSRAASEMSAAAQVSRTTVDRFLALAEVLRETSTNMGKAANTNLRGPAAPAVPKRAAAAAKPRASSFGDAIRQLRSAAQQDSEEADDA